MAKGIWTCGGGSGRQSGRSGPQSQRCAEGRPIMLPPVSYRQAQSLPAMQASCPSRDGVQAGWADAGRARKKKSHHMDG